MSQILNSKMCCICLNEFNNWRGDQICCSRKCAAERKRLKQRIRDREKPKPQSTDIEITCMFPGCNNKMIKGRQATNLRYCNDCKPLADKRRRQKIEKKRYAVRKEKMENTYCRWCKKQVTEFGRSKFCSDKCRKLNEYQKRKDQRIAKFGKYRIARINRQIQKHLDKVIELKRQIS